MRRDTGDIHRPDLNAVRRKNQAPGHLLPLFGHHFLLDIHPDLAANRHSQERPRGIAGEAEAQVDRMGSGRELGLPSGEFSS